MNWKKAIGFGALLWIIMFVIVSAFVGFKIYDFLWLQIATAIIGGVISFVLAGYVKPDKFSLALSYGLCWVVVGVILDAVITMRFNAEIFSTWTLWLSYFLMLIAPTLRLKK
jgi:hypothetical protein